MTYRFLADSGIGTANTTANDVRKCQMMFVRIIKFLDTCSACGITRIASYYGVSTTGYGTPAQTLNGTGFNYWYEANSCGPGAWAVYRFGNATVPFYMLVQWAVNINGYSISSGNGSPASFPQSINNGSNYHGVGFMFAQRADGLSPWNGTVGNVGADTKGSPGWVDGGSVLFAHPRSNSYNGSGGSAASRMNLFGPHNAAWSDNGIWPWIRMNIVVDENNFLITIDWFSGSTNNYSNVQILYFGKYIPLPELAASTAAPYWSFCEERDPPIQLGVTYGPAVYNSLSNIDGGVNLPNATRFSSVATVSLDIISNGWGTGTRPYMYYNGKLDPPNLEQPVLIVAAEDGCYPNGSNASNTQGTVGYSDFIRYVRGIGNCGSLLKTPDGNCRVMIGNLITTNDLNSTFYTFPWSFSIPSLYSSNSLVGYEATL
jgi:hypothetical protein